MRVRCYDPEGKRLVFLTRPASPDFWDTHWQTSPKEALYGPPPKRSLFVVETERFVPRGSRVLEGGCGLAQNAWHLYQEGYRTIALDYVPRTLFEVQRRVPQVEPVRGDVRSLPLPDDSVDAYWSIGVIEHWYFGYEEARDEMARVLRPGGHLFLTFPYMSPLRKLRASLGTYPTWTGDGESLSSFYQFGLDHRRVAHDFEAAGFALVAQRPFLGVSGLEEELPQRLARLVGLTRGGGRLRRAVRAALAVVSTSFASHCMLLVLRRGGLPP